LKDLTSKCALFYRSYQFDSILDYINAQKQGKIESLLLGHNLYFPNETTLVFMPQKIVNEDGKISHYDLSLGGLTDPGETNPEYDYLLPVFYHNEFVKKHIPIDIYRPHFPRPFMLKLNRLFSGRF